MGGIKDFRRDCYQGLTSFAKFMHQLCRSRELAFGDEPFGFDCRNVPGQTLRSKWCTSDHRWAAMRCVLPSASRLRTHRESSTRTGCRVRRAARSWNCRTPVQRHVRDRVAARRIATCRSTHPGLDQCLPTACAAGWILSPLRGWNRDVNEETSMKRTVVPCSTNSTDLPCSRSKTTNHDTARRT